MIEAIALSLPGLIEIKPDIRHDSRGYFLESFSGRAYASVGVSGIFVQENLSMSARGVLRGLHFQRRFPQGKLVGVSSGAVYDVVVDLRASSPGFGRWEGLVLSSELGNQVYIPPGFAHGFLALSETAVVYYKCSEYYHPEDEDGIRWDDPTLGIEWPRLDSKPVLSAKDERLPPFDPERLYYP